MKVFQEWIKFLFLIIVSSGNVHLCCYFTQWKCVLEKKSIYCSKMLCKQIQLFLFYLCGTLKLGSMEYIIIFNTFAISVRIYHTYKTIRAAIFTPLCNSNETHPSITLKSCSKSPKTQWVCNEKNIFALGFFCEWHHKWGLFLVIFTQVTWTGAQPQDGSLAQVDIGN